jgi:phage baseplate assembly protein W
MANFYRGFSTLVPNKKFRLNDMELIKQDIINHFNIRKGEKLMNPNFGTIIWNVLHEPFTEELKSIITEDIQTIAKYDPRVSFDNIIVTEYERGLQIVLDLRYLQTNQSNTMSLQFDNQAKKLFSS